jgi:hypothetical protein
MTFKDSSLPETSRDWHLDRRLQITHILSTLAMGVGAILYVGDIRKDVEVLKAQQSAQELKDIAQDRALELGRQESQKRFDRIEDKLDRVLDYVRNRAAGTTR